jgi:hypothetical protein
MCSLVENRKGKRYSPRMEFFHIEGEDQV